MRFDVERAMVDIRALKARRDAGTDGERHAADYVTEQFERAGLRVGRREVIASRFPTAVAPRLGWLVFGFLTTLATVMALDRLPRSADLPVFLAGLAWLLATAVGAPRLGAGLPPRLASQDVMGDLPGEPGPPVRVVFLTPLDSPRRGWSGDRAWRWALLMAWIAIDLAILADGGLSDRMRLLPLILVTTGLVLSLFGTPGPGRTLMACFLVAASAINLLALAEGFPGRRPTASILAMLALLWAALAAIVREVLPDADGREDRSGLALLLELARGWTKGAHGRIETRFVATGAYACGMAGTRELMTLAGREWPEKPTLFIQLLRPERAPGFALVGRRPIAGLAEGAAADLWLPHRIRRFALARLGHEMFEREGWEALSLVGDPGAAGQAERTRDAPSPAESAALQAAAQLAAEIALRWARRAAGGAQGESPARSSQKPG